jgi:O-antigen/teichoic acid export membrane protein
MASSGESLDELLRSGSRATRSLNEMLPPLISQHSDQRQALLATPKPTTIFRRVGALFVSRLSKNILYNVAGQSLQAILAIVAVKYVYQGLGREALGVLYFALSLNAVLYGLLDMGITATVVREISRCADSDQAYVRSLVRTASFFSWIAFMVLFAGLYLLAPLLVKTWIHLQTLDPRLAVQALHWLGAGLLTSIPRSLYSSIFRGLQRLEISNAIDVLSTCAQQLGTIVLIVRHGTLLNVAFWFLLCYGLSTMIYMATCAKFLSWSAILPRFSASVFRRNLGFAGNMLSISITNMVTSQADKLAVSKLLPIRTFGPYAFVWSVVARASLLTTAIAQAAFPSFSSLLMNSDKRLVAAQYRKLQDLVCLSTLPMFALVCYGARPVLAYAFDAATAAELLRPVAWLCLGFYLNGALNIPYILSLAAGKATIASRSTALSLGIVLPVTILLVRRYGLNGAGFSWVFYQLFNSWYMVPRIFSQCIGIPAASWFIELGRILMVGAGTYGVAWMVIANYSHYSVAALAIGYGAASLGFVAGAYCVVGPDLRSVASQVFGR